MIIRICVRFTHVYIFQRNDKCSFPTKIVDNITLQQSAHKSILN